MFKHLWTGLCDLVYPPHCAVCKKYLVIHSPTDILCLQCQNILARNAPPFCPKCSRHLLDITRAQCPDCAKTEPHFDFAWAACSYNEPLKHLIHHYKYNQKTYLRKFFARLMADFVSTYRLDIQQFDVIIPVPLHPIRLRERGYNQSQLLAEHMAKAYQMNLSSDSLVRIRHTQHQTLLNEKERWTNIHEAFRIMHPAEVSCKNILVIDDLLTTGATASETARTLKKAGAGTVGVFTLAITG